MGEKLRIITSGAPYEELSPQLFPYEELSPHLSPCEELSPKLSPCEELCYSLNLVCLKPTFHHFSLISTHQLYKLSKIFYLKRCIPNDIHISHYYYSSSLPISGSQLPITSPPSPSESHKFFPRGRRGSPY